MRSLLVSAVLAITATAASAQTPSDDAFRVLSRSPVHSPTITDYLKYQTEMAWDQDDLRRKRWESIHSERELLALQEDIRQRFLSMIGGLPREKTPLRPRTTGRIQMNGFHIEKLIYESLPGIYVPALVYVPDDGAEQHPAVLVPSGH